ncbi:hypothetical protein BABINDRAFT_159380 [Babjeviella inositovora NRRL Y-12698]|uniref:GPI ethanolamine phosphate transferase 2 n=1 Tax=Babjeviella inositovora NRRL Y-12698 TaxID=984486 RepID=A0A1E3QZ42_9ASCO|nr:uncharacterized protein BABINDRAFT_159380 [Babjeviella inositovora NRRL Y-12698]ODQ82885.1 hypothetical protein BABINDRAFT_159380 [Babjeviella inositovora NRRL Y-12698]
MVKARWVAASILFALQLLGLLLFAKGFFPSKVVISGDGLFHTDLPAAPAQFSKLIFMVVDAMRSDFIFSEDSSMSFVHQLLNSGHALGFTAHSTPPTVTLPRLKGLTTGSTPNFLDAILNVAEDDTSSSLGEQDSWVKQLFNNGFRIQMFGDDTWLKLFPRFFHRTDGTNSFFVSDFTEVDINVTRHLNDELTVNSGEWDAMILHYLGLDHIGHKGGPKSVFMKPKQQEMDQVIEQLYRYVEEHPETLLVVAGDHGMNEIGNHGGASIGETSAGLVFISPKLEPISSQKSKIAPVAENPGFEFYKRVQQIDLVPTLSMLLQVPIPKNNLGVFIPDFLPLWAPKYAKDVLVENCEQIKLLVEASFGVESLLDSLDEEVEAFQQLYFLCSEGSRDGCYAFLEKSQSHLASSATNYNYVDIYRGFGLLVLSAVLAVALLAVEFWQSKLFGAGILGGSFVFAVSSFGSSLVEEEYQLWWWFATFFFFVYFYSCPGFIRRKKFRFTLLLLSVRVLRSWNNSGQKYITSTLGEYLSNNPSLLWFLILVTYTVYGLRIWTGALRILNPVIAFMLPFMLCSLGFTFKACQVVANGESYPKELLPLVNWILDSMGMENAVDSLVPLAKLVFQMGFVALLTRVVFASQPNADNALFMSDVTNIVSIVLINQTSTKNIPVFLVFMGIKYLFTDLSSYYTAYGSNQLHSTAFVSVFTLIMQYLSFFSLGNTNSLATVDLSNAYNGVESYNMTLVGVLTFLSNFAGPVYWAIASLDVMLEKSATTHQQTSQKWAKFWVRNLIYIVFYSVAAVGLVGACINLRFHLFIWSVFSPKLLYFVSWNVLIYGVMETVCLLMLCIY